jgi:hypothetical protein
MFSEREGEDGMVYTSLNTGGLLGVREDSGDD